MTPLKNITKYPKNPGRKNLDDSEYAWIEKHISTKKDLGLSKTQQRELNILLDKIVRQDNVLALDFLFQCGFQENIHLAKDEYLGRVAIVADAPASLIFLGQQKYDFSRPVFDGEDFLQYAARLCRIQSIDALISITPKNSVISPLRAPKYQSALHTALLAGYPDIFVHLLNQGVPLVEDIGGPSYKGDKTQFIANYFDAAKLGVEHRYSGLSQDSIYQLLFTGLEQHINIHNCQTIKIMLQDRNKAHKLPQKFEHKINNLLAIMEERRVLNATIEKKDSQLDVSSPRPKILKI